MRLLGHARAALLLALVALVAQLALPHLHTVRWATAGAARSGARSGACIEARQTPTGEAAHHDAASCPVCQALGQRAVAAAKPALEVPRDAVAAASPRAVPDPFCEAYANASSRAPPVLS